MTAMEPSSAKDLRKEPSVFPDGTLNPFGAGLDTDHDIARKIQSAMIPRRLPEVEGLEMASLYLPGPGVGGDHFDIIQLSDDIIAFLIFEVTGHRVASTLISALAKVRFVNHIRALRSPRAVIDRVNTEIIKDVAAEFYLTAFVGYLDLHDNKLTYSNAGHVSQALYRRETGAIVPLRSQGTIIGILDKGFYDEQNIYLSPGDWLLMFTDGIIGVAGGKNTATTRDLFDGIISAEAGRMTPAQFVAGMQQRAERSLPAQTQTDDVSLVAVEMLTQSRRNQIKEKLGFPAEAPVYLQTLAIMRRWTAPRRSSSAQWTCSGIPTKPSGK
jgi:phosphoserine phosphatase RsbU/P